MSGTEAIQFRRALVTSLEQEAPIDDGTTNAFAELAAVLVEPVVVVVDPVVDLIDVLVDGAVVVDVVGPMVVVVDPVVDLIDVLVEAVVVAGAVVVEVVLEEVVGDDGEVAVEAVEVVPVDDAEPAPPVIGPTALELTSVDPFLFVAVTATRTVPPTSPPLTVNDVPVAEAIAEHEPPPESHDNH